MAQISKWGNSLAVRLPSKVVKALDLHEGDEITMGMSENGAPEFVIRKDATAEQKRRDEALERLVELPFSFPAGFKFDREEATARHPFEKDE